MYIPIWIIGLIIWILAGSFCAYKQGEVMKGESWREAFMSLSFLLGPIWLIFAFIRQTIIEDWD